MVIECRTLLCAGGVLERRFARGAQLRHQCEHVQHAVVLGDSTAADLEDCGRLKVHFASGGINSLKGRGMSTSPASVDGHEIIGGDDLDDLRLQVWEGRQELFVHAPLPFAASALPVVDEIFGEQVIDHIETTLVDHLTVEALDQLTIDLC